MIRLRQGETTHDVVVRSSQGGVEIVVDGQVHRPVVESLGGGRFVLLDGPRRQVFHCVRAGDSLHVAWDGQVHVLEQEREGAAVGHRHAGSGLEAPMPGKVIKVAVAPGDAVEKGDELLVIEAMKMENALRAPRAGRVKSLACKVGEMVNPGVVLLELE